MSLRQALAAVALVSGLAGCVSTGPTQPDDKATPAARNTPTLVACQAALTREMNKSANGAAAAANRTVRAAQRGDVTSVAKDAAVASAVSGVIPFEIPVAIFQKLPTGCAAVFTKAAANGATDKAGAAWDVAKDGAERLWERAKDAATSSTPAPAPAAK